MPSIAEVLKAKRAKIEQMKEKTKRLDTIKPVDGRNVYRLLPAWNDDGNLFQEIGMHWIPNPDPNKTNIPVLCNRKTYGDDHNCDACDLITDAIRASRSDEEIKELKGLYASQRYIANVLVKDGEGWKSEVQKLEFGQTVYDQIEASILGAIDDDENFDITDPKNGHNVVITRSGKGFDTSYSVMLSMKPSAVDPKLYEGKLFDLAEEVRVQAEKSRKYALEKLGQTTGALPPPSGGSRSGQAAIADLSDEYALDADFDEEIPDNLGNATLEKAAPVMDDELDELDDLLGDVG